MRQMKGDKGRQMNPSTKRAVPGTQASRRLGKNKRRQMNASRLQAERQRAVRPESRARHRLVDNGRQINPSWRQRETNQPVHQESQASRLRDNARQMKGDKGRQMNPFTKRGVPGIQAGRQRETNEGRQRETNEPVHQESRARHPGLVFAIGESL